MKYLMMLPILGLVSIHVVTWFGILPPSYMSFSMSFACVLVFLAGLISAKTYASRSGISLGEKILGSISFKPFLYGLVLAAYFCFNFFYSASTGGNTKIENGKYFAMREPTKEYYEITESEYDERQPHQVRAMTGHPLIFGIVGFVMFCASRSSNKSSKRDAESGAPS
tara:strand:+ start:988 stop:1491 length:504 start_codon:yes stop_codon:yes gene_type:complete